MSDESGDLFRLLSEPVVPEKRRGSGWRLWGAALVVMAAVTTVVLLVRSAPPNDSAEPLSTSVTTAAVSTDDTPAASDLATSTLPPLQYPSPRFNAGMALDPIRGSILMLGGHEDFRTDPVTDAWLLDAERNWRPIPATFEPPGRELPAMIYADAIDRILVIGGSYEPTFGCGLFNFVRLPAVDVWSLDSAQGRWELSTAGTTPPDRWGHAAAYDPVVDKVVLFGGAGARTDGVSADVFGDTWLYDPTTDNWEEIDTPVSPAARACHGMVYDPGTELVYLWGGQIRMSTGNPVMWSFDVATTTWTEVETHGDPTPIPRWDLRLVYEPVSARIYVIGGFRRHTVSTDSGTTTEVAATDEVWMFDPETGEWEERSAFPAATGGVAVAADGQGSIIAFLGMTTVVYDTVTDTWTDVTPYELLDLDE